MGPVRTKATGQKLVQEVEATKRKKLQKKFLKSRLRKRSKPQWLASMSEEKIKDKKYVGISEKKCVRKPSWLKQLRIVRKSS